MADFGPKLSLVPKLVQRQILTPSLVQMVNVLALNRLELREMINQEMVENPILDELPENIPSAEEARQQKGEETLSPQGENSAANGKDPFEEIDFGSYFQDYLDPGYKSPAGEVIERPSFENFLTKPTSLSEHLEWQLGLTVCEEAQADAGFSIIGNLDEDGYLTTTLAEIAESESRSLEDVEAALALVQGFDPLGVAARDLKETLLIQLKTLAPSNQLAQQIVSSHLHQVENKQYRQIARALNRPVELVERSVELIKKLDPRPGQRYNSAQPRLIEPDVYFVKVSDGYQILVNDDGLPQLRLSPYYRKIFRQGKMTRDVKNYMKERLTSAIQLIKNLEQRKRTIIRVCETIIRHQTEFLDKGFDHLKPMMIKEVAEEIGVHPSTVSRAVASKYAHTLQGVLELRRFFSEAVRGPSSSAVSLVSLKRTVKKMIENEDSAKPLTDDQITKRLNEMGIRVTRRTVAKYREDMRIPSTHQRRVKA